jgi:hypothetical protein
MGSLHENDYLGVQVIMGSLHENDYLGVQVIKQSWEGKAI